MADGQEYDWAAPDPEDQEVERKARAQSGCARLNLISL
jgi:hypothetical protein